MMRARRTTARRIVLAFSTVFRVRGGIPRFNQMVVRAVDELAPRLGLDVVLISQDDTFEDWRRHGRSFERVRFVPGGGKWGMLARTWMHCVRERPDLMLVGHLGMTPLGSLCRPFLGRGFGFVAHGYECWPGHPLAERRPSRHRAARRADFVFAVSDYTARELGRLVGIPIERILSLPNTIEPQFGPTSEGSPTARIEGPPEILTVSRLWPEEKMKGVDHTIEAVARLAARHPGVRLRIVGQGGDRPRLEELARRLGVAERVGFEQDLSDAALAERYRDAALFALPSGQEGFGIVFLEAMQFAKPCVGGDTGGTPEVVEHERTGLLVRHGDVDALVVALDRLLADPGLRDRFGQAGRERLLRQFSFDQFGKRLAAHLESLFDGPRTNV